MSQSSVDERCDQTSCSAEAGVLFNALHEFKPFDADKIRQKRIRDMNDAFSAFSIRGYLIFAI